MFHPAVFYRRLAQFGLPVLLCLSVSAKGAEGNDCSFGDCHSHTWLRNPRVPKGLPYGNSVRLGTGGSWVPVGENRSRSIGYDDDYFSPESSETRIAEEAYLRAYLSFQRGKKSGKNLVEDVYVGNRWKKRIVTEDGFVLLKDDFNNVALKGFAGAWYVLNAHGQYAVTTRDLSAPTSLERIAAADLSTVPMDGESKDLKYAKNRDLQKKASSSLALKTKDSAKKLGRSLASVDDSATKKTAAVKRKKTKGVKQTLSEERSPPGAQPEAVEPEQSAEALGKVWAPAEADAPGKGASPPPEKSGSGGEVAPSAESLAPKAEAAPPAQTTDLASATKEKAENKELAKLPEDLKPETSAPAKDPKPEAKETKAEEAKKPTP